MKKLGMLLMLSLALVMGSQQAFSQAVTITLNPGWTWISYSRADTLDFATALGTFTPMEGDIIKSQYGFAMYQEGQWSGGISHFYPGLGYMYRSMRTVPTPISFGEPAPQVIVTTMEPTDITTNSATCGGNVASSDGNYVFVILRGICWSTNPNPTFNDNYVEVGNGIGSFTASMTDLSIGTTYYVRAFAVTANGTYYGDEISFLTQTWSNGILPGAFSVSADQQVYFSQGNLQYQASTNTWRFAEHQWDYVGGTGASYPYDECGNVYANGVKCSNNEISSNYSGWIDLFGWGTSGYDHGAICYQPWSISDDDDNYYAYGDRQYNLFDQTGQADWGYNAISNGGNIINQWHTLAKSEWYYVFFTRTTTSGARYAKARVNGVGGVILLPDDWNMNIYNLNNTNIENAHYDNNVINASQWLTLENAGAVFLPITNQRDGNSLNGTGTYGIYWTSSSFFNPWVSAYAVIIGNNVVDPSNATGGRSLGLSVRLVCNAE